MCAMDRSGDVGLSQSVIDVISSVKSIYNASPVSVCVRNDRRETLYSNTSFQQLYQFFKIESEKSLLKIGSLKLDYLLSQIEFDCMSLGQGCVLCKSFRCGKYNFQVRMESLYIPEESVYVLWQINLLINLPLTGGLKSDSFTSTYHDCYIEVVSRISVKNLESLSFVLSGYTYGEAAYYLKLPASTVRKRVEKSREIINESFGSFVDFRSYLYKTKKIFFFVDYVANTLGVKDL
ncbi:hypothetical protein E5Q62_24375 [Klebsiella oxytoca]|uniref:hypothetical protein n=1 Tax=Klebsiella oxytoca TaxID=571 RepID=UPI0010923B98|nr:hypothetical protein [Klebsiella oxytoca]TGN40833.1 hypothetical protein E5Q62_24375 [Klebsiella oxytoca]